MPKHMPKKENFKPRKPLSKEDFDKKLADEGKKKEGPLNLDRQHKPGNDASWYRLNADVADVVARLPFAKPLGLPLFENVIDAKSGFEFYAARVPGVMSIIMEPRVPANNGNYLTMKTVAQNIYSWVRHANSGHANYDPIDLLIYLFSVGECYSFLGWMWGIYTRVCLAAADNRYYGKAVLNATGADYDSFIAHRNDFFSYINLFADRLQTLAVPAKMPFFMKKFSQYVTLYSDREGWKGQVYIFRPATFMKFDVLETTGGCLKWMDNLTDSHRTYEQILAIGEEMLGALLQDEDAGIISGDIIKATKDRGGIFTLPRLIEGTAAQPVVNVDILSQIHNLNINYQVGITRHGQVAYQQINGEFKISEAVFTGANAQLVHNELRQTNPNDLQMLDAFEENPSPDRVIEMTRLTGVDSYTIIQTDPSAGLHTLTIFPDTCDVFACVKLQVLNYVNDGVIGVGSIDYESQTDTICGSLVPFDYGPLLYSYRNFDLSEGAISYEVYPYIFTNDIVNPLTVHAAYLRDVNFVVINSLFAVPALKHLS